MVVVTAYHRSQWDGYTLTGMLLSLVILETNRLQSPQLHLVLQALVKAFLTNRSR